LKSGQWHDRLAVKQADWPRRGLKVARGADEGAALRKGFS
jgi:hypothetical protein